jgi:hypothetical protein
LYIDFGPAFFVLFCRSKKEQKILRRRRRHRPEQKKALESLYQMHGRPFSFDQGKESDNKKSSHKVSYRHDAKCICVATSFSSSLHLKFINSIREQSFSVA